MSDETDRRAVLEDAILRKSADGVRAVAAGLRREPEACAAVNAVDESGSDLSASADDAKGLGTPCFQVFIARSLGDPSGRSVGGGHHLHSAVSGVHVPGCDHRLVQSVCGGVEVVEQFGEQFLRGRIERGLGQETAGDFQYGPGRSVHESGVHEPIGVGCIGG